MTTQRCDDDHEASKLEAFRQHLKSCTRRNPCARSLWHEFDISDNPDMYMEEKRKHRQAELARRLRKLNQRRLADGYNPSAKKIPDVREKQLVMEKRNRVIKLSNVKLIEEDAVGTLETHANGFQFTSDDSRSRVHCLFKDIKASFLALADKDAPPLLHIHLGTDNEVTKRETKDMRFHLLMTFDSEKQQKQEDRNPDLENFVYSVENKWRSKEALSGLGPIQKLDGMFSFHVVFQGRIATLELTFFSMVVTVALPSNETFFVVNREDIEIVNFHNVYDPLSNPDMIEMTVVCEDFKIDGMLEIQIPLESFSDIKSWLHRGSVKYYVNNVENWKSRVKEIAEDFQTFLEHGGWDQFSLEDNVTIQDYYSMSSESEHSSDDELWGESCSESDSEDE